MILAATISSLAIWVYCLLFRGGYWRSSVRDDGVSTTRSPLPRIVAIVPARNEAASIQMSLRSLLDQDYPGAFSIVMVDDNSDDGTAEIAERLRRSTNSSVPVALIRGKPLPPGWTGKLWALHQGVAHANAEMPEYLLLTDADIVYDRDVLSWLVSHAAASGSVLTSLMVKLRCESPAERAFVPAFVYFFQMLYPFSWVNNPRRSTAAAAGGCMLIKADTLARAGGIAVIRDALIDDCSLAKEMKARGPIWLGLTQRVHSIRISEAISDIHAMVSRSAYAQLQYSPLLLILTLAGMALTYWTPVLVVFFGGTTERLLGLATWAIMTVTFWPTLRLYGSSPFWAPALPAIATGYMAFTLSSAFQHMFGRGGRWKGRYQAKKA
ncbi:MAG: glycosyltransferase [Pseudorhodoplanes sp.]|uniref:glycosyltransferase n=1 Tax=Pseudorhodoplanes sp. TaxID=1934341 RepID=UPI003D0B69F3